MVEVSKVILRFAGTGHFMVADDRHDGRLHQTALRGIEPHIPLVFFEAVLDQVTALHNELRIRMIRHRFF
ncbi:hypothetical protein D3C84_1279110 [compost metagenome]